MIEVMLPDGNKKQFEKAVTVSDVAFSIGERLGKQAIAGKVDGQIVDLNHTIDKDTNITIITDKTQEGLDIIRHSTAHLLAHAVKTLFPKIQVTIGPVIENGFYYDFAYDDHFSEDDLIVIEAKMKTLVKEGMPIERVEMPRDEAIELFKGMGEEYKVKIIEEIPKGEVISLYKQGDFIDLCRGPHVPNTHFLKAFKLTKVSGAYWRGDSSNEMLQRIYGTAWGNKKSLDLYLHQIEEATKRDHRKLGKQLSLFHMQDEAPGMVFWHHNGWTIYRVITDYIRNLLQKNGYIEVHTPQIVNRKLWEKSGHWDKFHNEMFITKTEQHLYAIKPMNCPCHVQIFNQGIKSYRDLPIRMSEFGSCHRKEHSGSLHGLMRVRNFVIDDAHIFCTEDQIQEECSSFISLLFKIYKDFGFEDVILKLSTRPEDRVGSDEIWDRAEQALEVALNKTGMEWEISPGEGAFYGPKIEFSLKDCLGRVWQCGTLQVDFSMPERLGANYIDSEGKKRPTVMLHRAILGSIERFIGILVEHYAGLLPLWLSPIQAIVLNITDDQSEYARKVVEELQNKGLRAELDLRNEKISFKIREHTLNRVPYMFVVGKREVENQTVSVRLQIGQDLGSMTLDSIASRMLSEIEEKKFNKE